MQLCRHFNPSVEQSRSRNFMMKSKLKLQLASLMHYSSTASLPGFFTINFTKSLCIQQHSTTLPVSIVGLRSWNLCHLCAYFCQGGEVGQDTCRWKQLFVPSLAKHKMFYKNCNICSFSLSLMIKAIKSQDLEKLHTVFPHMVSTKTILFWI